MAIDALADWRGMPHCTVSIRGWGMQRAFGLVFALALAFTGAYATITTTYRALSWDTFDGTVTRCDDVTLKSPTCFASFTEDGRVHEVEVVTSGSATPPVGEPVTLWVSPDRDPGDVAGRLPLLLGPVLLTLGLAVGSAVIFWPWLSRSLRRSKLLWGIHVSDGTGQ